MVEFAGVRAGAQITPSICKKQHGGRRRDIACESADERNPSAPRSHGIMSARMSPEPSSQKTQACPTCGTRLSETATRCPVCGTDLSGKAKAGTPKKSEPSVEAARMPEVTLSLPVALGLLALFLAVGAIVVYRRDRGRRPNILPSPPQFPAANRNAHRILQRQPIHPYQRFSPLLQFSRRSLTQSPEVIRAAGSHINLEYLG